SSSAYRSITYGPGGRGDPKAWLVLSPVPERLIDPYRERTHADLQVCFGIFQPCPDRQLCRVLALDGATEGDGRQDQGSDRAAPGRSAAMAEAEQPPRLTIPPNPRDPDARARDVDPAPSS